eukprot:gene12760-16011_t
MSGQDRKGTGNGTRGNPRDFPPPENAMWMLPDLGSSSPKRSPGAPFTLPKARTVPTINSVNRVNDSGLFSMSTLPQLDALELPGATGRRKLPSIEKTQKQKASGLERLIQSRVAKSHSEDKPMRTPKSASEQVQRNDSRNGSHSARSSASDDHEGMSVASHHEEEEEEELEGALPAPIDDGTAFDPDMVPGINTGEDVIEFYGKYGQDSAVKFFYCNRATASVRFRPYDLVVVSRQKTNHEYFTMSATGVTRIRKGVQAEFYSLSEWLREKTLFDLISNLGFFKNYLTGRCFRRWHKGVRQKNFNRIKSTIEASLFLAKPTFCPALSQLFGAANEIRMVNFTTANPNHLYNLQDYAELQITTREQKARPALETIVDKMQKVVERVCKEVQKQAKLYQESVRDQAELDDTTGVELIQGRAAGCHRSMVQIKKEKQERSANFARVMKEVTMLGNFVRLADYLFVEGNTEEVLSLLTAPKLAADKQSKGTFITTIAFVPDSITFSPDNVAVLEEMTSVVEGIINIAQQAPRLLFMRAFAGYFQGKPSGINPPAVIRSNEYFQDLRDYTEAREYVQLFEEYRKIYDFGCQWSYESYSAEAKTLRDIRRDMHKQREWRNELDRMKISNVVGCLLVDSKALRNDLMPVTLNTLDKIKLLLLNMSRDTCLKVLEDIQRRVSLLQGRPAQLDEFMAYQVMHSEQVEQKKATVSAAAQPIAQLDEFMAYQVMHSEQVEQKKATVSAAAQPIAQLDEFMAYQVMHSEQVEQKKATVSAAAQVNIYGPIDT